MAALFSKPSPFSTLNNEGEAERNVSRPDKAESKTTAALQTQLYVLEQTQGVRYLAQHYYSELFEENGILACPRVYDPANPTSTLYVVRGDQPHYQIQVAAFQALAIKCHLEGKRGITLFLSSTGNPAKPNRYDSARLIVCWFEFRSGPRDH